MKSLPVQCVIILFWCAAQAFAQHGTFSSFAPAKIGEMKLGYPTEQVKANPDGRGIESFRYTIKSDRQFSIGVSWAEKATNGKKQYLLDFLTLDDERSQILLSPRKQVRVQIHYWKPNLPISRDQIVKLAKSVMQKFEKFALPWTEDFNPAEFPHRVGQFGLDSWDLNIQKSGEKVTRREVKIVYCDRDDGRIQNSYYLVIKWVQPEDIWPDEPLEEFAELSYGNYKHVRLFYHPQQYVYGAYFRPPDKELLTSRELKAFDTIVKQQVEKFSKRARPRKQEPESKIKVFLELTDTGRQFTPNDTAQLRIRFAGIEPGQHSRLKARISIEGALVQYTALERNELSSTSSVYKRLRREPALWFGELSNVRNQRILTRTVSVGSTQDLKIASDDEMNFRFFVKLFSDKKIILHGNLKPKQECYIPLKDVFRVTINDGNKTVFDQRVPVTAKSIKPVIMYPDLAPVAPMPPGSTQDQQKYYRDGDPGWIQPGHPLIRTLAMRAACYRRAPKGIKQRGDAFGGTWIQYQGDPDNRQMPEDAETAVNNIAHYVFDAFFPKNWPEPIESPTLHATNLLTETYGPGKWMNQNQHRVKTGFACIEHAYMFGALVRALGIPVREVNNLQYSLPLPKPFQDASNDVYFNGKWNYFSLFPPGSAPLVNPSPMDQVNTNRVLSAYVRKPGAEGPVTSYQARYGGFGKVNYRFNGLHQYRSGLEGSAEKLTNAGNAHRAHRFFSNYDLLPQQVTAWEYEGKPLKVGLIKHDFDVFPPGYQEYWVITVHSPVVVKLVLPDGKQVGADKSFEPGILNEQSLTELRQNHDIRLDIKNSLYLPEGTGWTNPPSPKVIKLPQTMIIPGDPRKLNGKLILKATGTGSYHIKVSHVTRAGVQQFEQWKGNVTRVGELKEHLLTKLVPTGERHAGTIDSVLNLSGNSPAPFFGIVSTAHDQLLSEQFGIRFIPGILIARVIPNSPAETAGLKSFDVVTKLSGRRINSRADLRQVLKSMTIETPIDVEYFRENQPHRAKVQLGPRIRMASGPDTVIIAPQFASTGDQMESLRKNGTRLTEVAYGGGQWMTVLRQNVPHNFQAARFYTSFEQLKQDVSVYWKHGWSITNIAFDGQSWSAVFSKGAGWGDQILLTKSSVSKARPEIQKYWDQDYRITAVDHDQAGWVIVMTQNCGFGKQSYKSTREWSKIQDWIRTQWDAERRITDAAYHNGYWFLVSSADTSIPPQRWSKRKQLKDFKSRLQEILAEGDRVHCLAGGDDGWLVISSKK